MAIFHLSAHDRVSRSAGQSSLGSAAYMMRAKFTDERTGSIYDYRHYGDQPEWVGMFSPKGAPDWTRDAANAERFWNALELFEKRKDAQIALPFDIAMPHEMTLQQNIWLAQDYIRENFTRDGYVVLAAMHPPDHDERNIHLHLLVSLRKIDANGFARTKTEQQENYKNRDAYVENLREKWERLANRHLERHGIDARIDRRSLQQQGIDRTPQRHRGPSKAAVVFLEQDRKAKTAALAEIEQLQAKVIDLDAKRAERAATGGPRTDEAEKNYSKQQGGEISPQPKDQAMPDEQSPPANQNTHLEHRSGPESVELEQPPPTVAAAAAPQEVRLNTISPDSWNALPEIDFSRPAKVREAWQQPAFSLDTIRQDPWTAVYLPAPENASPILLNEAYNAAGRCMEAIDNQGREYADAATRSPLIPQGNEADNRAKAEARRDELQAQLFPIGAPAAEQPQRERTAFLEATAHDAAREITGDDFFVVGRDDVERQALQATPEPVRNDPVRTLRPAEPQPGRYDQLKVEIASEARRAPNTAQPAAKAPEIDLQALQSPDPVQAPTAPAEVTTPTGGQERAASVENLRPVDLAPTIHSAADQIERSGSRLFGWLADQFASGWHAAAEFLGLATEPKMTAQQVHDTLQANVGNLDKDHAQAVDAAQQADVAAYEQQAHELKTAEQQKNLTFSQRFGTPPTAEANPERDRDLEPD